MSVWNAWSDLTNLPPRRQLIDVVYKADKECEDVWIMCRVTAGHVEVMYGPPMYWRLADELPEGLEPADQGPYGVERSEACGQMEEVLAVIETHEDVNCHEAEDGPQPECVLCRKYREARAELEAMGVKA